VDTFPCSLSFGVKKPTEKHSLAAGIWTKDLKNRTNLQQPQVTKILKNLDARGLVKSVKAVAHPTRKLYMLAELEPARELTGGSWCGRARSAYLGTHMQSLP
jgi:hypothetical protein